MPRDGRERRSRPNWDAIKKAEKQRESVTDGIPMAQPALRAWAAKLVAGPSRAGLAVAAAGRAR